MTVRVEKPSINVREKLAELDKPTGIAGEAMLRAETPQEQFNLIGAGRRNLIINGDMRIAQRGTSAITVSNNTYQSIDRWFGYESSAGAYTIEQSTGHTADTGFYNALKLSCTTATSSIGSNDYVALGHRVEANDAAISGWGTSSAQDMVLSFWVRSSKTGTYGVSIEKQPTTLYRRVSAYTIDVANTWQKVTLTFSGYQTTAITDDNTAGFTINWWLMAGSTYSSGTLAPNTWHNTAANRAVGQVNVADSTSNEFYITGVQLEVGDTATPFEHRSFGDELARCQRYFQRLGEYTTNTYPVNGQCYIYGSTNVAGSFQLISSMRESSPTVSFPNGNFAVRAGSAANNQYEISAINSNQGATQAVMQFDATVPSGIQVNTIGVVVNAASNRYMFVDAEL